VEVKSELSHEAPAARCDPELTALLARAVARRQREVPWLTSGAGHDAAAMAATVPVSMLFVRCKNGLSHHPDESASLEDIGAAISIMNDYIKMLAEEKKAA
jgi:allantoate deiminase